MVYSDESLSHLHEKRFAHSCQQRNELSEKKTEVEMSWPRPLELRLRDVPYRIRSMVPGCATRWVSISWAQPPTGARCNRTSPSSLQPAFGVRRGRAPILQVHVSTLHVMANCHGPSPRTRTATTWRLRRHVDIVFGRSIGARSIGHHSSQSRSRCQIALPLAIILAFCP